MSQSRRYRFGPLERRTVAGPLRAGQVLIAGAAALAAMLAAYGLRDTLGLCLAVAILGCAALVLFVPLAGRTLDEWAPVLGRWTLRRVRRETTHRSTAPGAGTRVSRDGLALERSVSLPPELADISVLAVPYRQSEIGVIRDLRGGTYTAAMAVRGGSFGLCEPSEQERKLGGWGAVLASTARDSSPVRRLQWVERTLPPDGDELASYLQSERDRTVPIASSTVESYIELIEAAAPATQEHEVLVALQIDPRRASRDAKRLGGGDEGACAVLVREAETLAERLSIADMTVHGLLRPAQYGEVIRDGFDPYGRRGRSRASLHSGEDGVDPALLGPIGARESWDCYRSDSAFHATYWIASWPRSDVGAAFLTPLLAQTSVVRAVGVSVAPVGFTQAIRRAEAAQTSEEADEIQRQRQGFSTTARTRRRREAVARREEELADGHAEMRFAGYLTVSGRSTEDLERNCAEAEHAAQLSRLDLQRLYGEQAVGFTFTLPLCRGLA